MESRTIPYLASIMVEKSVRAAFLLVRLSSLILAHSLDSGVFGISDLDPSIKTTILSLIRAYNLQIYKIRL